MWVFIFVFDMVNDDFQIYLENEDFNKKFKIELAQVISIKEMCFDCCLHSFSIKRSLHEMKAIFYNKKVSPLDIIY